jgi:hypothetical protein
MFISFQNVHKISKFSKNLKKKVFIKFQSFNVYIIILKNICNIQIKDFLLCQYAIYGPSRIILTEDEVNIILTGPYITY